MKKVSTLIGTHRVYGQMTEDDQVYVWTKDRALGYYNASRLNGSLTGATLNAMLTGGN